MAVKAFKERFKDVMSTQPELLASRLNQLKSDMETVYSIKEIHDAEFAKRNPEAADLYHDVVDQYEFLKEGVFR